MTQQFSVNQVATHLAMLSIFSGAVTLGSGPSFLNGNVIFSMMSFCFLAASGRIIIDRGLFVVFLLLTLHGLFLIFMGLNALGELIPTLVTTAIMFLMFYNIILRAGSYIIILRLYVRYAVFFSAVIVFQWIMYQTGISFFYNYSWFLSQWGLVPNGPLGLRANGFYAEPSQLGIAGGTAIAIAVCRLFGKFQDDITKQGTAIILVSVIFSASAVAFAMVAVILTALTARASWRSVLVVIGLPLILAQVNIEIFESIITRFTGIYQLYVLNEAQIDANASSYSLYAHSVIAWRNFGATFGIGSGIGSHALTFEKYQSLVSGSHNVLQISTAGNLSNRLISELGILGLGLLAGYAFVLVRSFLVYDTRPHELAVCIGVFAFLFRNGTYAYFGIALLVCCIVVASKHKTNPLSAADTNRAQK